MFEANYFNRIRIYGSGDQVRTFIHVDRLAITLKNMIKGQYDGGIYNVVESTYSINQIADVLRTIYPGLEMVFVNQNMEMRSLAVQPDERLFSQMRSSSMREDLLAFKAQFAFGTDQVVAPA